MENNTLVTGQSVQFSRNTRNGCKFSVDGCELYVRTEWVSYDLGKLGERTFNGHGDALSFLRDNQVSGVSEGGKVKIDFHGDRQIAVIQYEGRVGIVGIDDLIQVVFESDLDRVLS